MSLISVKGEQSTSTEISKLTELTNLGDPNADRVLFWDDSTGALAYLTAGSGLTISGTSITASAAAASDEVYGATWNGSLDAPTKNVVYDKIETLGSASIGGTITGGTAGSVLFIGAASVLAQDNANFFWDDALNRLGIGTAAPDSTLHVIGTARIGGDVLISTNNTFTNNAFDTYLQTEIAGNLIFRTSGSSEWMRITDAGKMFFGSSAGATTFAALQWNTTQTPDTFMIQTGSTSNHVVIAEGADSGFDFAHAATTNPTLFIHSAAQSTTQWMSLEHDGTNGVIGVGTGGVAIESTSGGGIIFAGPTALRTYTVPNGNNTLLTTTSAQTISATHTVASGQALGFGNAEDAYIAYETAQTPDTWLFEVPTSSRGMVIMEKGDGGFDFAHPLQTNPTLFIHSAVQSTTQWISLTHNQTDGVIDVGTGGVDFTGVTGTYKFDRTITAAGTTGAQTINKTSGTVNFAAAATSLVVTNSLVDANSIVYAVLRTNDATARIANVTLAAGSFTINLTAATTAETSCGFLVTN